jgi:hypothetical protein
MHLRFKGGASRWGTSDIESIHRHARRHIMDPISKPRDYCHYEPREHQRVCLERECAIHDDGDRCVCPKGHECRPGDWLVVRCHEGGRQGVVWSPDADEGRLC